MWPKKIRGKGVGVGLEGGQVAETYSEACPTPKMERFAKIVNGF